MLTSDYKSGNISIYSQQSQEYSIYTAENSLDLRALKRKFETFMEVFFELGFFGQWLFGKKLQAHLKSFLNVLGTQSIVHQQMFSDIAQRFDCTMNEITENIFQMNANCREILYSPKVLELIELIKQCKFNRCIVFVQRIEVAELLSKILVKILATEMPASNLKVDHVTGTKSIASDVDLTTKNRASQTSAFFVKYCFNIFSF